MSTANLFGAGAARDVGYPLASDIGDGLLDFMSKPPDASIRASGHFLIDTFGRSPNIVDLITELESRVARLNDSPSAVESRRNCPSFRAKCPNLGRTRGNYAKL
jgi:hypothetical protein